MKYGKILAVTALVLAVSALFIQPTISKTEYYSFEIGLPDEVTVLPGETKEVEGKITVTGMYWLHLFELECAGTGYDVEFDPSFWEHVRIVRGWNSETGLVRLPETFTMTISVPEDAEESSTLVVVRGQEHHSFREVSNTTQFVLNIGESQMEPYVEIKDLVIPEFIDEDIPFELSFLVENVAPVDTEITVRAIMPDTWQSDESSKTFVVGSNSSINETFTIIPTTESGTVSLVIEYPFKGDVINLTKTGPYLIPGEEATGEPSSFGIVGRFFSSITGFTVGVVDSVSGSMGDRFSVPILICIIVILVILIAWLIKNIMAIVNVEVVSDEPENIEDPTVYPDQVTLKEI